MKKNFSDVTNAVAITTPDDEALMKELMDFSGENSNSSFTFIPYLSVDNSMVEIDASGRTVKARCEGRFTITTKEDKEYKTEVFVDKFSAILLAYRHQVRRKYKQDQQGKCINNHTYFRSDEFKSFNDPIMVRQDGDYRSPLTYNQIKTDYGDEVELWGICYFVIEGEDEVRKIEVKGASRGALYDAFLTKRAASISSFWTDMSVETVSDAANPYNKLVVKVSEKSRPSLKDVVNYMNQLKLVIDHTPSPRLQHQLKVSHGELVDNSKVNTDELLEKMNTVTVDEIFEDKK
jgi:hypothetical protein